MTIDLSEREASLLAEMLSFDLVKLGFNPEEAALMAAVGKKIESDREE
jgi:hypothetical protein